MSVSTHNVSDIFRICDVLAGFVSTLKLLRFVGVKVSADDTQLLVAAKSGSSLIKAPFQQCLL